MTATDAVPLDSDRSMRCEDSGDGETQQGG